MNDLERINSKSEFIRVHSAGAYNEYIDHRILLDKDKKEILDILSRALLTRTNPGKVVPTDDGYYIGEYLPSDDLNRAQHNLEHNFDKLEKSGWIDNGKLKQIEYKVNLQGCRSKNFSEIKDKNVIIGIGCSITFGVGLNQQDTWIHKLAEALDCEYVNISAPGCSTFVQSLLCTEYILEEFTNVKGVYLFTPPPGRLDLIGFEHVSDMDKDIKNRNMVITGFVPFIEDFLNSERKPSHYEQTILLSAFYTSFFQATHDRLLLKYKCELEKIPFFEIDSALFDPPVDNMVYRDLARDLMHSGKNYHNNIFKAFLEMQNTDK